MRDVSVVALRMCGVSAVGCWNEYTLNCGLKNKVGCDALVHNGHLDTGLSPPRAVLHTELVPTSQNSDEFSPIAQGN